MSLTPSDHSSEREISVPVNLDDDGFLRRECPHCEREFKWLPSDDSEPMQPEGYHCPYCDRQAGPDQWFTRAQVHYVGAVGLQEFAGPLLDDLEQTFGSANRSGGFIDIRFERGEIEVPPQPDEPNDMRRVEFRCHPKEPVKVLEEWEGPIHCLICGRADARL
jgi:hypothetical protein